MDELRFDGRVAVVTGAGRGLGRAYALLLAARGAAVVVNDLGGSVGGSGHDTGPADDVVAEIVAAGGAALADDHDVADPDAAAVLVESAVERFGGIDVVVNNAGIMRWGGLPDLDVGALERHFSVHAAGSFNTVRAAWPHMAERGRGRVVMTTSAGVFGLAQNTAYAAAKGAVLGLTRSLAVAGSSVGIAVNAVAPAAVTRMAPGGGPTPEQMSPEQVAPLVAWLAHDDCDATGEVYAAGARRFARIFVAQTPGYLHPGDEPSIEDVAAHWAEIGDEAGYRVPADLMDWSVDFTSHLGPAAPA